MLWEWKLVGVCNVNCYNQSQSIYDLHSSKKVSHKFKAYTSYRSFIYPFFESIQFELYILENVVVKQLSTIYCTICFIVHFGDELKISSFVAGDFMDILALLNSAINFILYCSMSRQFRTTFTILFKPKFIEKWIPVAQDDDENNMGRTDIGKDNNGHTTVVTQV